MSGEESVPDVLHKTDVSYALDRTGYTASSRLVFQHYIIKDVTGSLINPRILTDLRASAGTVNGGGEMELNVADIGTGTATWTLEVAQGIGMPGIRFNVHGFDISDDQFPSGNILPSNCQLSLGDAVVAPPEALRGTFDIVHVSQFACVRPLHEDPGATIEHAMALLKPGGWIQWDEWYRNKENKVDMVKLASSPRCDWALGAASKVFPEWLIDGALADHFAKHGVVEAKHHKFEPRNDQLPAITMMWYLTADEVVRIGFEEPTKSLFLEALAGAYEETRDKSVSAMFKMCVSSVLGKKPMSPEDMSKL